MDEIEFANLLNRFTDKKYALSDPSKGWDCLNSLKEIYTKMGADFPLEFEGTDENNYADLWMNHHKEAKGKFKRYLYSLGYQIDANYALPGDLMIFEGAEMTFPGVYQSSGMVMMVFDKGVRKVALKFFQPFLKQVRRLA